MSLANYLSELASSRLQTIQLKNKKIAELNARIKELEDKLIKPSQPEIVWLDGMNWHAIDRDGDEYQYDHEPTLEGNMWAPRASNTAYERICNQTHPEIYPDWKILKLRGQTNVSIRTSSKIFYRWT